MALTEAEKFAEKFKHKTAEEVAGYEETLRVLSTGIFGLDMALGAIDPVNGNGGIRQHDVVELLGPNNVYKTGTLEWMIKATQDAYPGKCVAVVFSEPFNKKRFLDIGIDLNRLYVLGCHHPDLEEKTRLAENALNALLEFSSFSEIKLCAIDSLAAMVTLSQLDDRDVRDADVVAALAKVVNRFMKMFMEKNKGSVLVYTNHYKEKLDTNRYSLVVDNKQTMRSTGGVTKDFLADVRILVTSTAEYEEKPHPVLGIKLQRGWKVKYSIFKNKYANTTGTRPASLLVLYKPIRLNNSETILDYAAYFGYSELKGKEKIHKSEFISPPVVKAGSWTYIGDKGFPSIEKASKYLDSEPELKASLAKQLIPLGDKFYEGDIKASANLEGS